MQNKKQHQVIPHIQDDHTGLFLLAWKLLIPIVLTFLLACPTYAVDRERFKQLKAAKQQRLLNEAKKAAAIEDVGGAEQLLEAAERASYNPEAVGEVKEYVDDQRTVLAERERREREERERIARLEREEREQKERQRRERKERERKIAASTVASATKEDVNAKLSWDYSSRNIYVPPTYKTERRMEGWPFPEYVWETKVDRPSYSYSDLEKVYFSVRLKNTTNSSRRVTYRITARERFSVSKVVGNTFATALMAFAGGVVADALDVDFSIGAAAGAGYELSNQQRNDAWFQKTRSFTVTLNPFEERFESGSFRVKKSLVNSPQLQIVKVE